MAALRKRGERGAELVEMACVMPLLLLMLVGIFDVGLLMNQYSAVTNAAREGARVAVVPGWVEQDVRDRVDEYLAGAGLPLEGVLTTVEPVALEAGTRTVNAVRVVVSYPYDYLLFGAVAAWFSDEPVESPTLTGRATMRMEVAAGL